MVIFLVIVSKANFLTLRVTILLKFRSMAMSKDIKPGLNSLVLAELKNSTVLFVISLNSVLN